jgi:2-hydroxychromene-2-carboxylate isomerase
VGKLISLTDRIAEREQERAQGGHGPAAFFFALDCPVSYLVAERVERDFGEIAWMPTLAGVVAGDDSRAYARLRRAREEASTRRLPLLEPDGFPFDPRPAARAAVFAANCGATTGAAFALAAMRLAFGGGFDLSDPDVLAEAAAAAGMPVEETLSASEHSGYDAALEATANGLQCRGILEPPVVRICGRWFSSFEALAPSSAFTAARASYRALSADQG